MNDNLINGFIYKIRKYNDDIVSFAKNQVSTYYTENQEDFKKVGKVLQVIVDENITIKQHLKHTTTYIFYPRPFQINGISKSNSGQCEDR